MTYYLVLGWAFLFGACIGSFLNVCIYRLPEKKSIVRPRSMCPGCGTRIAARDNIPLLSYLLLRARCRQCGLHIPIRYFLVELMTGLFAAAVFVKFGLSLPALIYFLFICALLVITFIDIDHQIIPDVISLPGIPLCFLASFALPGMTWRDAGLGVLIGGGSLLLVAVGYQFLTKKEGMGGGDVKLLAMIGGLIGVRGVFFTIFFSSAIGTLSGLAVMARTKGGMKLAVPFGPFLSIAAILYIFFGREIIRWYFTMLG